MERYERVHNQVRKERVRNRPIEEEEDDEQLFDEDVKQSPIMQFGTNEPILIDSGSGPKYLQGMSFSQYSAATSIAFRSEADWFSVREWYSSDPNTCQKLRRSH